jgi:hypothetical protein
MHSSRLARVFSARVFSARVFSARVFSARVFSATVLAGALALAGCAPTAATTDAAKPGAGRDHANIMVYSINSDGPHFRAVVTGAVGDYGPAVTVSPDGKVNSSHTSDLELNLTHGSFRISIADIDKKFVRAASHEPVYPRTCSDFMSVAAAAPIVAGSGTGSYRGISGSFDVTITADEVNAKPCHPVTGFLWQVVVLAGPGTVSLG